MCAGSDAPTHTKADNKFRDHDKPRTAQIIKNFPWVVSLQDTYLFFVWSHERLDVSKDTAALKRFLGGLVPAQNQCHEDLQKAFVEQCGSAGVFCDAHIPHDQRGWLLLVEVPAS